jgi:pyrimidine-nucleoside phosphorylase
VCQFRRVNFLSLIEAKRDGHDLDPAQIKECILAYTAGKIPDYQMAAFLMAVYFRGLTETETAALMAAMRDSGDVLRFPDDPRPLVDKHSTGGIGDKVSLPLAPLLACLGFRVPIISGRGLGITGGTLDKLDSIPGFNSRPATERIVEIVQTVGCVICGQTSRMVPADMAIYALRDATATVPSIPLIVASILSKKLAESLDALVLDVKFGSGAFMPTLERARELGQALVKLASDSGVRTRALLTNMETPVGHSVGNWLEIKESVACLEGNLVGTPSDASQSGGRVTDTVQRVPTDLKELVVVCAAHLLVLTGKAKTLKTGLQEAADCLASGKPREKWNQMLAAQGADLAAFHRKLALDHTAPVVVELQATASGFVSRCDARILGEVVRDLGGGRFTKESGINYDVGVDALAKPGERIQAGDVLTRVHAADRAQAEAACARLKAAFDIATQPPTPKPLVAEII